MKLAFVVSTQDDKGKNVGSLASVNSHIATYSHARARALRQPRRTKAVQEKLRQKRQEHGTHEEDSLVVVRNADLQDVDVLRLDDDRDNRCLAEIDLVLPDGAQRARSLWYGHGFDDQLSSCLDPFLQLPIKVSERERNLIHFYLTEGRRNLFGSSKDAAHCLTLHWTRRLMPHCQQFVYGMILVTEYTLSQIKETPVPDKFYLRRAQNYRAMSDTLEDDEATIHDKIVGLLQMAITEQVLGYPDLHKQHARALNMYIEQCGGVAGFVRENRRQQDMLESWVYFTNAKYAEVRITNREALDATADRFVACLGRIGDWASSLRTRSLAAREREQRSSRKEPVNIGSALIEYVDWLLDFNLTHTDTGFELMSASFHYIFCLCLTPTVLNYDIAQSNQHLDFIEGIMAETYISPPRNTVAVRRVDPFIVLHWLQSNFGELSIEDETYVCQLTSDMLKIIPLLSSSKRLQLARDLANCAFAVASPVSVRCFGDGSLQDLRSHVSHNWVSQQLGLSLDSEQQTQQPSMLVSKRFLDSLHQAALANNSKETEPVPTEHFSIRP